MLITLKDNVKIDVIVVTESGIRSSMMKPAEKKEVVVSMKGVPPNTRDSLVLDYLSKFGKIVTTKVVHGVFLDAMKYPRIVEAEGWPKNVNLKGVSDYILGLWEKNGYTPPSGELAIDEEDATVEQVFEAFSPVKVTSMDEGKYAGVTIRQFPRGVDHGEVIEFLCNSGLPGEKTPLFLQMVL